MSATRPRILEVLYSYAIGGSQLLGLELARQLRDEGAEVLCTALDSTPGPLVTRCAEYGLPRVDLAVPWGHPLGRNGLSWGLVKRLRALRLDAGHLQHFLALNKLGLPSRLAGVKRIVCASTASIYGMADNFPTTEKDHPYNNRTWYGASKIMLEGLLRSFNDMYGTEYCAFRYFNVYGPRMDIHGKYTEVLVRCFGAPRDEPGTFAYGVPAELALANPAITTLGTDLSMAQDAAGADLVHSHTWYTNLAGHLSKLAYDIPHLLSTHSLEPLRPWKREQLGGGYRLSSWVERTAYEGAAAVIAVSNGMRTDILDCYPAVDPKRVHRLSPGQVDGFHTQHQWAALDGDTPPDRIDAGIRPGPPRRHVELQCHDIVDGEALLDHDLARPDLSARTAVRVAGRRTPRRSRYPATHAGVPDRQRTGRGVVGRRAPQRRRWLRGGRGRGGGGRCRGGRR